MAIEEEYKARYVTNQTTDLVRDLFKKGFSPYDVVSLFFHSAVFFMGEFLPDEADLESEVKLEVERHLKCYLHLTEKNYESHPSPDSSTV